MAFDEKLVERIRDLTFDRANVTEKKMFGGLAFLVSGNMAITASGEGGILVRVGPDEAPALLAKTKAVQAEMRGRSMTGWLRVAPEHLATKRQLAPWVKRSMDFAATLPPK